MTFRILAGQMEALGAHTRGRFLDALERYLRERFPDRVAAIGSAGLGAWLDRALAVAHAHRITAEPEAAQLILLLAVIGIDAEARHPWAADTLGHRTLNAKGKVRRLVKQASQHIPESQNMVVYPNYREVL